MSYTLYTHPHKKICLVDMNQESSHFFSYTLTQTLASYIRQQKKILIINNKKGYASGLICRQCGHIPKCTQCDVPIAICLDDHHIQYSICHICKTIYPTAQKCLLCQSQMIADYGMGNQKIAERIMHTFHTECLVIDNKKTQSLNKIHHLYRTLEQHNIVIATSILTRPSPSRIADLIVMINADIGLQIPDFDSDRKQFQVLYELLIAHQTPHYILQTHNPQHHTFVYACALDPQGFDTQMQTYLQTHHYPPYGELCLILYKHEIEDRLFAKVNTLYQDLLYLREKMSVDIEIYATPPLIYKIYNTYRYHIIIKGEEIRAFVDEAYTLLDIRRKGFHIDRMPVSLLG